MMGFFPFLRSVPSLYYNYMNSKNRFYVNIAARDFLRGFFIMLKIVNNEPYGS